MAGGGAGLAKRLGTFFSGVLECGAFCGIIFGWASLVFVLKDLGYFSDLCQPNATHNRNETLLRGCSRQDGQFALVFTIGSFMNNFVTFPMGFIFDRFGTTVARLIAISLYTGGTLLVAFSTPELAVLLFPAMSMLSVGGILLILTNMQVGNLFGKYRSIIITLYNGAFDSSSAIFLIIKLLYEHGLSLRTMFLFMAACSAWHLLRTLFLMPRTRIPYPLPPAYDYGLQCPGRSQSYRTYEEKRPPEEAPPPEETPLEPSAPRAAALPLHRHPQPAARAPGARRRRPGEQLHQRLRLHPALRGALRPVERPHPRPAQAGQGPPPRRSPGRAGRPAGVRAVAGGDGDAVRALLDLRGRARAARPVRHLRAAGDQPLLPLRGQRRLPGRRVPPAALREAVRAGHGTVGAGGPAAVPLRRPGARAAPWGPLLRERGAHRRGAGGLRQSRGGGPRVPEASQGAGGCRHPPRSPPRRRDPHRAAPLSPAPARGWPSTPFFYWSWGGGVLCQWGGGCLRGNKYR
ncbi:equilibrative nucleobase transporter 1 isoform X3 [Grus americana]|uniref:equilibrative nucleobase transporter 1 isoform X3 n=1 Tax=Grus americana TaxID=9117 RepID=UPI0024080B7F|nr:equilibrative nucleobase transporter 1 isoform X3 [Grus americana]